LAGRFFLLELLENLLHAILGGHGLIEQELNFGGAAQCHARTQQMPNIRGGACKRLRGLLALLNIAHHRPIDPGERKIGRDFDAGDGHEAHPGICHLAREDLTDLFADLCGNAFDAVG
jgi:hypothetical protein